MSSSSLKPRSELVDLKAAFEQAGIEDFSVISSNKTTEFLLGQTLELDLDLENKTVGASGYVCRSNGSEVLQVRLVKVAEVSDDEDTPPSEREFRLNRTEATSTQFRLSDRLDSRCEGKQPYGFKVENDFRDFEVVDRVKELAYEDATHIHKEVIFVEVVLSDEHSGDYENPERAKIPGKFWYTHEKKKEPSGSLGSSNSESKDETESSDEESSEGE